MSASLDQQLANRILVLYDGYCALCNNVVRFLIHHDSADRLRFAPFDTPAFQPLLARHGIPTLAPPETIVAVTNFNGPDEELFTHSTAILKLLEEIRSPYPAAARTFRLIPTPIRDFYYRLIARNRFHIHPRLSSCPIPTETERRHFLD